MKPSKQLTIYALIYTISIIAFFGYGYHCALSAVERKAASIREASDTLEAIQRWQMERGAQRGASKKGIEL